MVLEQLVFGVVGGFTEAVVTEAVVTEAVVTGLVVTGSVVALILLVLPPESESESLFAYRTARTMTAMRRTITTTTATTRIVLLLLLDL